MAATQNHGDNSGGISGIDELLHPLPNAFQALRVNAGLRIVICGQAGNGEQK
ncbi:hypothetical protein SBA1_180045 [Candidatus Sulfotelmatobacter kueseliae]|uniref:Uncharacterized protein n=1 Tax=Candidatus Sulfotelmatobacter kueseliae TaxID=2042962 RepID=A0A2U3KCN7_9BACT|nr:hypothetical protein SBA1_180045 [Candidatus Sulfotelmatobacter kueseliae]